MVPNSPKSDHRKAFKLSLYGTTQKPGEIKNNYAARLEEEEGLTSASTEERHDLKACSLVFLWKTNDWR
uniref:Uncharacterized protein n=1 Tax=Cucumis melo TaxID=3656 RepID=A0A9I9DLI8_CUCME